MQPRLPPALRQLRRALVWVVVALLAVILVVAIAQASDTGGRDSDCYDTATC